MAELLKMVLLSLIHLLKPSEMARHPVAVVRGWHHIQVELQHSEVGLALLVQYTFFGRGLYVGINY
ncbi:hypothetical protein ABMH07_004669 [Escherichia coli]